MGSGNSHEDVRKGREFTAFTKRTERDAAKNKCRLCGRIPGGDHGQYAHIISCSNNRKRFGTDDTLINNLIYIRSWENCLYLCYECHKEVDSNDGLEKYTVDHLKSLKDPDTYGVCRTLGDFIKKRKSYRCKSFVHDRNSYFCIDHEI